MTTLSDDDTQDVGDGHFCLIVHRGESMRTVTLEHGCRWIVGRASDCNIQLNDPTVSRRHVVLERSGQALQFRDLGGTNTTLLNGRPTREGKLPVGKSLIVGSTSLTLQRGGSDTQVRMIERQDTPTSVLFRPIEKQEGVAASASDLALSALAQLLDRLVRSPLQNEGRRDIARVVLEAAMQFTQREEGAIGVFSGSEFEVLATIRNSTNPSPVTMRRETVIESRTRPHPHVIIEDSDTPEQIIAPFECFRPGLLLLQSPAEGAPSGPSLLPSLPVWAAFIGHRLKEVDEKNQLRDELGRLHYGRGPSEAELVSSARLRPICQRLDALAKHSAHVFLAGPPGTEKEELAYYLHAHDASRSGRFVPIYAGVLSASRVGAELFGSTSVDGAQVVTTQNGLKRARAGTLYIDQPQRMPPELQRRLASEINALADTEDSIRLVAGCDTGAQIQTGSAVDAPNTAIEQELAELFDASTLYIPRLADHPSDIINLAELDLAHMGPGVDGSPRTLLDSSRRHLIKYDWPQNTRQLVYSIEAAAARAGHNPISPRHLPDEVRHPDPDAASPIPSLEEIERRHIVRTLGNVGWSKRHAAKVLGIAISTLYKKLEKYRIEA